MPKGKSLCCVLLGNNVFGRMYTTQKELPKTLEIGAITLSRIENDRGSRISKKVRTKLDYLFMNLLMQNNVTEKE